MVEIWKDVKGYENYSISSIGNVISKGRKVRYNHSATGKESFREKKEKLLKPVTNKQNGYKYINLSNSLNVVSTFSIHRLVAINFVGNINNKPCVNHIDGIKTNNVVSNLEWCTYKENSIHSSENNLTPKGEKHYKSVLSNLDVSDIRKSKMSVPALARYYGVEYRSMWQIVKGIRR